MTSVWMRYAITHWKITQSNRLRCMCVDIQCTTRIRGMAWRENRICEWHNLLWTIRRFFRIFILSSIFIHISNIQVDSSSIQRRARSEVCRGDRERGIWCNHSINHWSIHFIQCEMTECTRFYTHMGCIGDRYKGWSKGDGGGRGIMGRGRGGPWKYTDEK